MKLSRSAFLCLWLPLASLHAQAGADWNRVEHLSPGQVIRVRSTRQAPRDCTFVSADENTLNCTEHRRGIFVPRARHNHYRRQDVRSIKLARQDFSTFLGGLIGAGAGAGIAAGLDASAQNDAEERGALYFVFLLLGGSLGAGIGHAGDFFAGPTLYQVP